MGKFMNENDGAVEAKNGDQHGKNLREGIERGLNGDGKGSPAQKGIE